MEITLNSLINFGFLISFGLLAFLLRHVFSNFNKSIDKLDDSIVNLNKAVSRLHSRVSKIEGKLERD